MIVKGIFPDDLKIVKITLIYKADNSSNGSNYTPISVLPCFSKMPGQIICNLLSKYLKDQNILYNKQFGFRTGHSADHAIAQLVDQIYKAFEKNEYTLGVFIALSRLSMFLGIRHGLTVVFQTAYSTFKLMKIAELDIV